MLTLLLLLSVVVGKTWCRRRHVCKPGEERPVFVGGVGGRGRGGPATGPNQTSSSETRCLPCGDPARLEDGPVKNKSSVPWEARAKSLEAC